MPNKTVLYDEHIRLNGHMVDYANWEMPTHYTSLVEEHNAVRNNAGLFDVSHMGEVDVKGKDAIAFVQYIVTNNPEKLVDNQVLYSMMCYEDGGVVDDLLIYKYNDEHFLLVVNASNVDKDFEWMKKHQSKFDVELENISNNISLLALQGPKAQSILQKITDFNLDEIKFFTFNENVNVDGNNFLISRTGYTGEDGFEIYGDDKSIPQLWKKLLEVGASEGLLPAGLGCRDTLRFEANLPLYGNELSDKITPIEAGYGYFVAIDTDFIGKEVLADQKTNGVKQKIVGFELLDKGVARHGYEVELDGEIIGEVTTGYHSITLDKSIGLALIKRPELKIGDTFKIKVRNRTLDAKIISRKFLENK